MRKALLIIDVQNDYFPGGRMELYKADEALSEVKKLITHFREENAPVIYIQHLMKSPAPFFEEGTKGAEIHPRIKPNLYDYVIEKHCPNSFYETNLQETLQQMGVTDLHICGMMSHMCVDTTVRAAKDLGYEITVYADACTTCDLNWRGERIPAKTVHETFMTALNGAFAKVI